MPNFADGDARSAALRAVPLLRDFTDVGIRIIADACEHRAVSRGSHAFRGGEPSPGLIVVVRGKLQLVPREGGAPLGDLAPGDTACGLSVLQPSEALLTAVAAVDVDVLLLTKAAFDELEQKKPSTALKLRLAITSDVVERMNAAKGPLREFLVWQTSRRQA